MPLGIQFASHQMVQLSHPKNFLAQGQGPWGGLVMAFCMRIIAFTTSFPHCHPFALIL
jgi:hypothetical protein